jgi:Prenyltransferase and squalene oxidase repeat
MEAPGAAEVVARARTFAAARGSALERTRLAELTGDAPRGSTRKALGALQDPEGAFALAPGGEPGLSGTLAALAALDDVDELGASDELERAAAWLAQAQQPDGGWSPPAGGEAGRLVASGLVGGFLAKTPCGRTSVLRAVGAFLGAHWSPERVRGGDFGALVAYAQFFANHPSEVGDEALQWCGRELERGFRSGRLSALRAARVLALCRAGALPGGRLGAGEIANALLAEQERDGGWPAPGCDRSLRVAATLDALAALRRLGGSIPC